jgi:hypothetical protein
MAGSIRITEADLRSAMREARYWRDGHPEREAFGRWVANGWRALCPTDGGARAAVWVRAYSATAIGSPRIGAARRLVIRRRGRRRGHRPREHHLRCVRHLGCRACRTRQLVAPTARPRSGRWAWRWTQPARAIRARQGATLGGCGRPRPRRGTAARSRDAAGRHTAPGYRPMGSAWRRCTAPARPGATGAGRRAGGARRWSDSLPPP